VEAKYPEGMGGGWRPPGENVREACQFGEKGTNCVLKGGGKPCNWGVTKSEGGRSILGSRKRRQDCSQGEGETSGEWQIGGTSLLGKGH